jgi:hypothetical protein
MKMFARMSSLESMMREMCTMCFAMFAARRSRAAVPLIV